MTKAPSFTARKHMLALPVATADTSTIIAAAQCALAAIWRPGFRYEKARVMLLDPVKADRVQANCSTGLMTPGGRPAYASRQAQQALRAAIPASMALQA